MSDRAFPSALSLHILPRVLCICPLVALRRPFLSRYVCVDWFTICFRPKGMENKPPQLFFEDKAVQWCVNEFGDCVLTRQICSTFRQCFKDPNSSHGNCVCVCACVCVCVCVFLYCVSDSHISTRTPVCTSKENWQIGAHYNMLNRGKIEQSFSMVAA